MSDTDDPNATPGDPTDEVPAVDPPAATPPEPDPTTAMPVTVPAPAPTPAAPAYAAEPTPAVGPVEAPSKSPWSSPLGIAVIVLDRGHDQLFRRRHLLPGQGRRLLHPGHDDELVDHLDEFDLDQLVDHDHHGQDDDDHTQADHHEHVIDHDQFVDDHELVHPADDALSWPVTLIRTSPGGGP